MRSLRVFSPVLITSPYSPDEPVSVGVEVGGLMKYHRRKVGKNTIEISSPYTLGRASLKGRAYD